MRLPIPSRSWGLRSAVMTRRFPAEMISFIVWKNSSWVDSLPAMNWTSSIISRSAARSRALKAKVSRPRSADTNSNMKRSADMHSTRAPGLAAEKA